MKYLFILYLFISSLIASNPSINTNKSAITIMSTKYLKTAEDMTKELSQLDIFINKINNTINLYSVYAVNIDKKDLPKYLKLIRSMSYEDAFETTKKHLIYLSKLKTKKLKNKVIKKKKKKKKKLYKKIFLKKRH